LALRVQRKCCAEAHEPMKNADTNKETLSAKLNGLRAAYQISREETPDPAYFKQRYAENTDQIHQDSAETLAFDSLTRKWEMTNLVSQALDRLKDETYGHCADCEASISPKRLAAIPWARYCMSCQEVRDGITPDIHWENAA
jgi:RNA polymerase-binding transcription factor DksA